MGLPKYYGGVNRLGKSVLVTPLYISIAWLLLTTYQLFTKTAVNTVMVYVNTWLPTMGSWLLTRIDMIVFIYAFAWVFMLSSVIPSVLLGKERSVLIQFFVCLSLTFFALVVEDTLTLYRGEHINQLFGLTTFFYNPILATAYLLIPLAFMLVLDLRSRRRQKKQKAMEKVTEIYFRESPNLTV